MIRDENPLHLAVIDAICESIKPSEIAKQSHFSEYHFHRLFHEAVGTSVMDYVRNRRLSEAVAELAETDEKITAA